MTSETDQEAGAGRRAPAEGWLATLERRAHLREKAGLARRLPARPADDAVIDLAGNDYLGLSLHPDVLAAAAEALGEYGLGSTGSRLVRGSTRLHAALETALAGWLGTTGALVFSSGYLANLGAVRALAPPGTLIVSDAHNHASLIDGCRSAGGQVSVLPHADADAARAVLATHPGRPAVVVTESVFSVDGDLAPLTALHAAARAHGALLLVDEAHALGVVGPGGAGAVAAAGLAGEPDVIVTGTLSKALGGTGGFVAGPAQLIRELVDTGRTFIFDTAPAPALIGGVLAAVGLARTADGRRRELASRAALAARLLRAAGREVATPAAGVLSVSAPGPEAAVAWAAACRDLGVAVGCFRPPSTPDERSRLRLTINVGVPRERFERAIEIIVECAP